MCEVEFQSVFQDEFKNLISLKQALGFKYETGASTFRRIDEFFCRNDLKEKQISKELCDLWCRKRPYESSNNHCHRISDFRVFCKYIQSLGYKVYVPPKGLTKHPPKYDAHIFTDDELERFFDAVDASKSVPSECPYRALVMPVFFRILYTSGMRVSELRLARIRDINLDEGYIRVRQGKNHKDRLVPVHPDLIEKCISLKEQIHQTSSEDEYFFMLRPGREMTLLNVYHNFRRYLDKAGISHTGRGRGPRVHDFRHTYCVNLLRKWAEEGKDLMVYLPYMKTMLGHETFDETAYYLKLTAASFPYIRDSLDKAFPDIIGEVFFNENEYY